MEEQLKKRLSDLEEKLAKYMPIFIDKKRMFRGIKHEDSLSELRYTQFMVYKEMVEGMQREINELKAKLRNFRGCTVD